MNRRYGWHRDLPDHRDLEFSVVRPLAASPLPANVDLRPQCPAVYDQQQLGSCTGNAVGGAVQFERRKQGLADFSPSRLFIYYNERVIEGTVPYDSGAQIRDGIKSVAQWGVCAETEWPYDAAQFAVTPPQSCFDSAFKDRTVQYQSIPQDLDSFRACLADGFPFVFGFTVYPSFESAEVAQTGIVPLPRWFERPVGGHAVMAVGYDDTASRFTVRNSWGPGWGDQGYFYFPYDYMTGRLSSDFWTIRLIES